MVNEQAFHVITPHQENIPYPPPWGRAEQLCDFEPREVSLAPSKLHMIQVQTKRLTKMLD